MSTQRITTQMLDNTTVNTIDNDLNQLDQTQEELSTGYQINQASDNPTGAAMTLSLQGQVSAYSAYQQNITQGVAMVETESTSLQQIQQTLQSAQSLTVEAANGTMSSGDLQDAAAQIQEYISEIKQTADTEYDGSYVFSGSSVNTAPWQADASQPDTFAGNTNSVNYSIGPSTQLPVSANLYSVLGDGMGAGGAFTPSATPGSPGTGGLLATLRTVYSDMESGNQSGLGTQLTNLSTNLGALESVQADVGATQDRLQMASSRISSLSSADTIELGNVYDTDMPAATTSFSTEQAGYQAALQSTADIIQTSLLNFLGA
jgi:flagellar hook-associated protein 3 FlgL